MKVGIFRGTHLREVMVAPMKAGMTVFVDGRKVNDLVLNDAVKLRSETGAITGKSMGGQYHARKSIVLKGQGFRLRTLDKKFPERHYPGSLELRPTPQGFLLIATVPLELYVAGVIQSEAGKDRALEYYKMQAVSCRTYALAAQRRHLADGFEVCDQTHCQVFHGRNRVDTIDLAVAATHDLVAVDPSIQLIHATFHSNCGGQTQNAEDLWSKSEAYLIGTTDTFCLHEPHASWTKRVPKGQWLSYLRRVHGVDTGDPAMLQAATAYDPPCRDVLFRGLRPAVKMGQVRTDMGFNSTYFRIREEGEELVFEGRGFGHGIGLCQEGAMRMARTGHTYTEILHHYFTDVHLVDLKTIDFFRDGP